MTLVDAKEGDAFVVDLRVARDQKDPRCWNRFIVDTGVPTEAHRDALCCAISDQDTRREKSVPLPGPWAKPIDTAVTNPPICGVIVTHTDHDHWGNARWLVNTLCASFNELPLADRPNFVFNPVPFYTSPAIQWAQDLQWYGRQMNDPASTVKPGDLILEDLGQREDQSNEEAASFIFDADCRLDLYGGLSQLKYTYRPKILFDPANVDAKVPKIKASEGDIRYGVRWVHKKVAFTVGRSFNSVFDLGKHLDYQLPYRFNFLALGKEVSALTKIRELHRTLTDD